MAKSREHVWDRDDTILTLYFVKYDLKGLPIKDDTDLAESVIGSTKASLVLQACNVRYLLGYDEGTLDCFSAIQKKVVDEYNDMPYEQFKEIVVDIIDRRDRNGNIQKVRNLQKEKENERKKKEAEDKRQSDLYEQLRKLGKDPSKMRSTGNIRVMSK